MKFKGTTKNKIKTMKKKILIAVISLTLLIYAGISFADSSSVIIPAPKTDAEIAGEIRERRLEAIRSNPEFVSYFEGEQDREARRILLAEESAKLLAEMKKLEDEQRVVALKNTPVSEMHK